MIVLYILDFWDIIHSCQVHIIGEKQNEAYAVISIYYHTTDVFTVILGYLFTYDCQLGFIIVAMCSKVSPPVLIFSSCRA